MGSSMNETPKRHILGWKQSYDVLIVKIGPRLRAGREPKNNAKKFFKKGIPKKPQHVFFHVFVQTTHVVAAPHGFACVGIPATRLYIPSFIEIRSRVSEPQGVKIWPFPLLWLVAFTTACTTVQAVINLDSWLQYTNKLTYL